MPPESWNGLPESGLGRRDPDQLQELHRARPGLLPRHAPVEGLRFDEQAADGEGRVEARHRVLEDHADLGPAQLAHLLEGQPEQVAPLEEDVALDDAPRRRRDEPHHGQRRNVLPTRSPRPTVSPGRIASDVVDGARRRGGEPDREVLDAEECVIAGGRRRAPSTGSGSALSVGAHSGQTRRSTAPSALAGPGHRRPSPRTVSAKTVIATIPAGGAAIALGEPVCVAQHPPQLAGGGPEPEVGEPGLGDQHGDAERGCDEERHRTFGRIRSAGCDGAAPGARRSTNGFRALRGRRARGAEPGHERSRG
jgi:hypothetical protein